jgi:hypothetical protein
MGNEVYHFLAQRQKTLMMLCTNRISYADERSTPAFFQRLLFYSTWRLTGEMFGQMMLRNFRLIRERIEVMFPPTQCFCLSCLHLRCIDMYFLTRL